MDVHLLRLSLVLKSRGITDSETITQKLIECFPKFLPLLQTRIPHTLVPTIWNDPLVKQIASFFGQPQVKSYDYILSSIRIVHLGRTFSQ